MSRITDLVSLAAPATNDVIEVVDVSNTSMAPTGTNSKLALSVLKTFIKSGPAISSALPTNPTATASTSLVMMGLGATCNINPGSSGIINVDMAGFALTATASAQFTVGVRYGTGTAPVNGAAVSGTRFGSNADLVTKAPGVGQSQSVSFPAILTLTPGTNYWFDFCILTSVGADLASVTSVSFTAVEVS